MIARPITYDKEEHFAGGRKGQIKIENLSPALSEEEYSTQQRIITEELSRLFHNTL